MPIRQFKPVTASSRFRSVSDFTEITRTTPEKSLLEPLTKSGGRDNHGHISMRRLGGGDKRKDRLIDFKRNPPGPPGPGGGDRERPQPFARIAAGQVREGGEGFNISPQGGDVGRG